ncbi:MAG: hypothetical protein IKV82_08595 [Akkermansia sp.]|nr:hypothetical protein [Akkermansia sp.]
MLPIKDNQPILSLGALLMFKHCRLDDDYTNTDSGHGQVEQCQKKDLESHGLATFGLAYLQSFELIPKSNGEYKALETRFYITSLRHVEVFTYASFRP